MTTSTERLTPVTKGQRIEVTHVNDRGDVVRLTEPDQYRVFDKCDHNNGIWICATHKQRFTNQFNKDTHVHRGTHQLAWYCATCNQVQVP